MKTRLGIMAALAAALVATIPMKNGRNPVRWYNKKGIGLIARYPRDNGLTKELAQVKRDRRNSHRLNTWTGVRHYTPHVPSTVFHREPLDRGRRVYL